MKENLKPQTKHGAYQSCLQVFILSLVSVNLLFAQNTLTGIVYDNEGKTLPFVNIVVQAEVPYGFTTNIEGKFRINIASNTPNQTPVVFSYVGYQKQVLTVAHLSEVKRIILLPKTEELSTVTIKPEEDPAYEIIRRAVARKKQNNPENLEHFKFQSYNKASVDVLRTDSVKKDLTGSGFLNSRFFMFESRTEVIYKRPGKWNEEVLATKMSGIEDPSFGMVSNSFQPFSAYSNHLNILEIDYLNPVSPNSENYYRFELADSTFIQGDLCYIINFEPRKKSAENLLQGVVAISGKTYSIVNIVSRNTGDYALMKFEIRQGYTKIDSLWFPVQSNTEYEFIDPENPVSPIISSTTFIDSVDFSFQPKSSDFGLSEIQLAPNAGKKSDEEWQEMRFEPLDTLDSNTYAVFDTLPGSALKLMNWMVDNSASLSRQRLGIGKVDLMLNHLVNFNQFEGFRLGLGLATNDKLIKWMGLEGYYAYGFKDKLSKYGGGLRFYINPKREIELNLNYSNDVLEPGRIRFKKGQSYRNTGETIRNLFTRNMDRVETFEMGLGIRPIRGLKTLFFLKHERRDPFDPIDTEGVQQAQLRSDQVGMEISFTPGEKLIQVRRSLIPSSIAYPKYRVYISRAIPGLIDGNQNFTKLELEFEHIFRIRGFGETKFFGNLGKVWGDNLSLSFLNYGRGGQGESSVGILSTGYFQSMDLYEFVNDEYVQLGIIHNFGNFSGIEYSFTKPELKMSYQAGIGDLKPSNQVALNDALRKLDHAYLEGGLILDNLLRFKGSIYYSGLGLGVFYRHGYYALPNEEDNFSFILSFAISL